MRWKTKNRDKYFPWFAWRPIRTSRYTYWGFKHTWVWLKWVERQKLGLVTSLYRLRGQQDEY